MLVLSRKLGEEIVIDGHIRIKIVAIKGDNVRVGIEAPPEVRVDRREVYERRAEFADVLGPRDLFPEPLGLAVAEIGGLPGVCGIGTVTERLRPAASVGTAPPDAENKAIFAES